MEKGLRLGFHSLYFVKRIVLGRTGQVDASLCFPLELWSIMTRMLLLCFVFVVTVAASSFTPSVARADEPTEEEPGTLAKPFSTPEQSPASEGVAELANGARLWYWDTGGQGEAIVLLHAATMSGEAWPFQQPAFAQAGYRVVGYSRRGYFRSGGGGADAGYPSKDLYELMEHLQIRKTHLVAAAHGGSFALDFTLAHPDRVASLTLVSSLLSVDEPEYQAGLRRLLPPFFSSLPADFKELSPSYRLSRPTGVLAWKRLAARARTPGAARASKLQNRITWKRLQSIKAPTLLVGGESDLYAPPPLLKLQAANIPGSRLVLLPEVGHSANWETPIAFNKRVLQFINAVE